MAPTDPSLRVPRNDAMLAEALFRNFRLVMASALCEEISKSRIGDCFVGQNRLLLMT